MFTRILALIIIVGAGLSNIFLGYPILYTLLFFIVAWLMMINNNLEELKDV